MSTRSTMASRQVEEKSQLEEVMQYLGIAGALLWAISVESEDTLLLLDRNNNEVDINAPRAPFQLDPKHEVYYFRSIQGAIKVCAKLNAGGTGKYRIFQVPDDWFVGKATKRPVKIRKG